MAAVDRGGLVLMPAVLATTEASITATVSGQVGRTARRGPGDRSCEVSDGSSVGAAAASAGTPASRERGRLIGSGLTAVMPPPDRWVNNRCTGATGRSC